MSDQDKSIFNENDYPIRVDNGRDIGAGHIRGCWLEFSDLVNKQLSEDPVFTAALGAAYARGSLLPPNKLGNLYLVIRYALRDREAHIFEFGSYMGGSAVFMATALKMLGRKAKVFAFDTFDGMPDTDPVRDLHRKGDFADSKFEGLRDYIREHALESHIELVKGRFDETLPGILAADHRPGILHIDCDIYEPIKYVVRQCIPHMQGSGYIILDDPLHGSCLGAFDAVQELLIRELDLTAEQAYPHLVYRYPPLRSEEGNPVASA